MTKQKALSYHMSEFSYDLPEPLVIGIGKIVTRWAYLTYKIQQLIWFLLNVTAEQGRVAVRDPRASDQIDIIIDLAAIRGLKPDQKKSINALKKHLIELSGKRDLLAHGLWGQDSDGQWNVMRMRGNWPDDAGTPHKSKRVAIEGIVVTEKKLGTILTGVDDCITAIKKLAENAETALGSSPEK